MILNSEETDVRVIYKENADGGINIRIESYNGTEKNKALSCMLTVK